MTIDGLILTAAIAAAQAITDLPPDPRVQLLPFEPNQVVNLSVDAGYAAVIEFAPGEVIDSVVIGNSVGWQVTPSSSNDRIVIKPIAGAVTTDMIVITAAHRYVFLLQPGGAGRSLFVLRFVYSDKDASASAAAASGATYRLTGAKSLFPKTMRDDGTRTTITWPEQAPMPAVFAVGDGGKEAIVNGRMMGGAYVIEGTSAKYIFRLGSASAVAIRKPVKARK